jgi:hypothetical protein
MSKMSEVFIAQERMAELVESFYHCSEEEQLAMSKEMNEDLIPVLLAYHGPSAPAHTIDPLMADCYGDLYKDRYYVRPRGHSYATMKAFMDNVPPLEDEDDEDRVAPYEQEAPEDEDRFDPKGDWTTGAPIKDEPSDEILSAAEDAAAQYGYSPFACLAQLLQEKRV